MQRRQAITQALARLGRVAVFEEEAADRMPAFYLRPEHVEPFMAFLQLGTQWRQAPVGRFGPEGGGLLSVKTGLDYAGVWSWLKNADGCRGKGRRAERRRSALFAQICACERGALQGWRELREMNR